MDKINRWTVSHPFISAVALALVVALATLLISVLFRPEGVAYGISKLWLSPLLALVGYLFLFLPMAKAHKKEVDQSGS
ncbi:hypothetical protein INP57_27415 [Saccharopolyspora sp. HNM0986]|uniref:hypothetical protein n=1 Tax=Saccharopolyspora galaxeae TaxID=2781241 RepID=UPI00190CD050|nr:hypothetical protein [Saccharopolyspora sp. HNM0986]MBK0870541.1 hypothetical protein [Saccharopolyspora sp. HNM0986]